MLSIKNYVLQSHHAASRASMNSIIMRNEINSVFNNISKMHQSSNASESLTQEKIIILSFKLKGAKLSLIHNCIHIRDKHIQSDQLFFQDNKLVDNAGNVRSGSVSALMDEDRYSRSDIELFSIITIEIENENLNKNCQNNQLKSRTINKSTLVIEKIIPILNPDDHIFAIGSWQSGDFIHMYAGIIAKLKSEIKNSINLLVIEVDGDDTEKIKREIEITLKDVCYNEKKIPVSVFILTSMTKECGITVLRRLGESYNVITPYDATLLSSSLVKNINPGQALITEWEHLTPNENEIDYLTIYKNACEQFRAEYCNKITSLNNHLSFVCIWDRTSGRPTEKRPLGGANPQYDSSITGNRQLCEAIKKNNENLTAIFTIGTDFSEETKNLDYVFDLGKFWEKMEKISSRFEQNRFFYYMTSYYNCSVVHVGMKSGGMDTLGALGQNVIFIDSSSAPHITRHRVDAWQNSNIRSVSIRELPTAVGKAIGNFWRQVSEETKKIMLSSEEERKVKSDEGKKSKFATTLTKTKLQDVSTVIKTDNLIDGFEYDELESISKIVREVLDNSREKNMINQKQRCIIN